MKYKFTLEPTSYFWTNNTISTGFDGPDYDVVVCGFTLCNGQRLTFRFLEAVVVDEHKDRLLRQESCTFYLQKFAHNWTFSLSQGMYYPSSDLIFADHLEILEPAGVVNTQTHLHTMLECLSDDVIEPVSPRVAPGHWEELAASQLASADDCLWFAD